MRSRHLLAALPVLIVVAAALAVVLLVGRGTPASQAKASVSAEAWSLPRLDAPGQVSLAQLRGTPVVVDFFASWCTACRDELPELAAMAQRLQGRVRFVGVDSEENGDGLAMARRYGIGGWTLLRDTGGSQSSGVRDAVESVPGMPVLAVYDKQGRLVAARLGALSGEALTALLTQHFGAALTLR